MATFSLDSFVSSLNSKLEPPVQQHLKNVYACVAISSLAAAVGGYVHVFTDLLEGNFLTSLLAIGVLFGLMAYPDDGKNRTVRLGLLTTFAFLSGLGLGPLLDIVIAVDPSIVPTAFLSTCLIFACFTLSAMFADQRQWLYIGGTLMSLLSVMLTMSLLNIFIGSYLLFKSQIYMGLALMCGFILYDTQLIIEKRRRGDRDYIWHSVDLFIDLIKIFRYILILLTDKEAGKKEKK